MDQKLNNKNFLAFSTTLSKFIFMCNVIKICVFCGIKGFGRNLKIFVCLLTRLHPVLGDCQAVGVLVKFSL